MVNDLPAEADQDSVHRIRRRASKLAGRDAQPMTTPEIQALTHSVSPAADSSEIRSGYKNFDLED